MSGSQRAFSLERRPAWIAVVLLVAVLPVATPQNLPPLLVAEDNQRATPLGIAQVDNETRKSLTLRLEEQKEMSLVGEVEF